MPRIGVIARLSAVVVVAAGRAGRAGEGHVIVRTFSGDKTGVAEGRTLNVAITATAGGNPYRFRDVGADHLQVGPDGTAVLLVIGQVPFGFTGVLKIDLATGEAILEPQHSLEDRLEDACATLTA
ncbi:MAG TPA: hypothetical protein VLB86_07895 [Gaiellaceae bacterium]|nr:hypothetical protein [Gaiellaceae bacterium]